MNSTSFRPIKGFKCHTNPFHDPTNKNLAVEFRDRVGQKPEFPLNHCPKGNFILIAGIYSPMGCPQYEHLFNNKGLMKR